MADYEAKGYTITRQWTDSRGRVRYSKTAPARPRNVQTEKVGNDVYERDPETGEWQKVVSGPAKEVNFNALLTEKDRISAALSSMPKVKKGGKPVDPEMYSALTNRLGHIDSQIKGTAAPEEPPPNSLAGRIKDMTNPMTADRYPGDWMTKRTREQERAVRANVEGSFDDFYQDVWKLEDLYAKQKGAEATGATALKRLDELTVEPAGLSLPKSGRTVKKGAAPSGPAPGTVENGFRFTGGDPSDSDNWEPVK